MIENNALYSLTKEYVPQSVRNHMRSTMRTLIDVYAGVRGLNPNCATPDFLMIGAQKAGTTSLFNWLVESGFVQSPLVKEIGYFNTRWHWPIKYRGYFKPRQNKLLVGEATPSYLAFPEVPERVISSLGPACKIIIVLRDPVDRTVSHYFHERRLGFEKRDMYTAMIEEDELIAEALDDATTPASRRNFILTHYSYVYRSMYSERLAPWLQQFDRDKLLIINSATMFKQPRETVESVAEFLGTDVKNPTQFNPRNANAYEFEDSRVASYLKERLQSESRLFNDWAY